MVDKFLKSLIGYVEKTDSKYKQFYEPNLFVHPIPFFGNTLISTLIFSSLIELVLNRKTIWKKLV